MSTLPEQFSAASKKQIEAQLDMLETAGNRAFDGAARLIALNIDTGRAAVDRTSSALKELASASDPRDLFTLARQPQDFSKMVAYGSQWLSIMTDLQAGLLRAATPAARALPQAAPEPAPEPAPVAVAPAPAAAPAPAPDVAAAAPAAAEAAPALVPVPEHTQEHVRLVKPAKKPVVALKQEAVPEPVAEATPIARAAGKVAGKPVSTKPAAAPLAAAAALPKVKPVEATPPPTTFTQDLLTPKRGKKR